MGRMEYTLGRFRKELFGLVRLPADIQMKFRVRPLYHITLCTVNHRGPHTVAIIIYTA